ncbi:MAG: NnrU family protein [Rhodobacteraceae bacterium]|nr:NnrU family protein [Paracoccaceae bacterium]
MEVLVAMAVFVASHVVARRSGLRPALVRRLGEQAYLTIYSVVSLLLLTWVIWALLAADRIMLWSAPAWSYEFAAVATFAGFILIGIGSIVPNPNSVAFRKTGFDPDRPGVVGWVRHPLILGLALWGLAHVPANGDWPSVILFGGTALFGVIGVVSFERRLKREFGEDEWSRLTSGRGHLDRRAVFGAAFGVVLWVAFIVLHPVLFGVNPWAGLVTRFG